METTLVAPQIDPSTLPESLPDKVEVLATVCPLALNPRQRTMLATLAETRPDIFHTPSPTIMRARLSPGEVQGMRNPRDPYLERIKDMNSPEYKTLSKQIFEQAFEEYHQSLEDLAPLRIAMVYRIVREMARIKSLCHSDEPLATALSDLAAYTQASTTYQINNYLDYGIAMTDLIDEICSIPDHLQCWHRENNKTVQAPGLPLCPPSIPLVAIGINEKGRAYIKPDYKTSQDATLQAFLKMVRAVCDHLNLFSGTKNDPDAGKLGLQGILDCDLIRVCWPTAAEIFAYERILIEDIVRVLVEKSTRTAYVVMADQYGFTQREIEGHMRMARAMARQMTERDQDEERGIAMLRLEEYSHRAKESLDLKAEMNALKQMAMITGLSRSEADDNMADFMDVVKTVSANAAKKATQRVLETAQKSPLLP